MWFGVTLVLAAAALLVTALAYRLRRQPSVRWKWSSSTDSPTFSLLTNALAMGLLVLGVLSLSDELYVRIIVLFSVGLILVIGQAVHNFRVRSKSRE